MSDVANLHAAALGAETTRDAVARDRVLFITAHFPPSREIGAHACEQLARYFPLYRWHPIVLTRSRKLIERLDANYKRSFPGSIVEAGTLPHPIWMYRKLKRDVEQRPAVDAPAGETAPPRAQTIRRWILSLLHTPDIYTGWIVPAVWKGLRVIRSEGVKRLFSSGPFWTNHVTGALLSRITGLPLTLHFRDPWMEVEQPKPVSAMSLKIEKWLESFVIATASSVVCVTDWHTRRLRESFPSQPAEKFVTIANGYDGAEWDGFDMDVRPADCSRFVITYSGGFVPDSRTPRPLFRALRSLIDAGEVDESSIAIRLFGNCDRAEGKPVAEIAREYGLHDLVDVGPAVGRSEAIERVQQSNLLLLLAEGWTLQIPGKTYEYLRSGRPILALTGEGALADLLRRSGGAYVADPDDDVAITNAIRETYANWKNGLPARHADRRLIESFDRRRLASRYVALFES